MMGQGTDDYIFVTPRSFDHKATCYAVQYTILHSSKLCHNTWETLLGGLRLTIFLH